MLGPKAVSVVEDAPAVDADTNDAGGVPDDDSFASGDGTVAPSPTSELQRELIGVSIGPPAAVRQPLEAAVLVTGVDLVAGFAGNAELTAEAGHLLAIE